MGPGGRQDVDGLASKVSRPGGRVLVAEASGASSIQARQGAQRPGMHVVGVAELLARLNYAASRL